jgi:hypothetical protein
LLSTAPDEDIQEAAKLYFELGLSDVQIVDQLSDHYDTGQYGLRYVNFYFDGEPLAGCLIQVVLSHFADCESSGALNLLASRSTVRKPFLRK